MKSTRTLMTCAVMTCALFVFGCNKSSQGTYGHPGGGSIDELVPEATRIIQEGLSDVDPQIRANAIEVVTDTKRIKLMPKVQRLLEDDFVPVRFAAALAVGDLEYSLAESSVKQLLKDKDENVRIAADYAMSKLGAGSGFELVRKATATVRQRLLRGDNADLRSIPVDQTNFPNSDRFVDACRPVDAPLPPLEPRKPIPSGAAGPSGGARLPSSL